MVPAGRSPLVMAAIAAAVASGIGGCALVLGADFGDKTLVGAGGSSSSSAASGGGSSGAAGGSGSSSSGGTTGSGTTGSGTTGSGTTGSGTTGSGTTSSGTTGPGTTCAGFDAVGGLFQAMEPWNIPADQDPKDMASDTIINWLASNGGWGSGNTLQIDFSFNVLCADATAPMEPFTMPQGPCAPDCDGVSTFPVPPGGAVAGEQGYACTMGGNCYLLIVDRATHQLYEMYDAFDPPSTTVFNSGSGAFIWDLTKAYPPNLRGDGCTGADVAGFPIAAMLFTADEVAAGHIDHAIRFQLPLQRIRSGKVYVHPATHTTYNATGDASSAPPIGVHFRLSSTFDLTKLPSGAQVVAKAMQKYGMFLANAGDLALTAAADRFTTAKWTDANVKLGAQDLATLQVTDFEVVDLGPIITTGNNCVRNP
jgi:serine/threonine-protein kinase